MRYNVNKNTIFSERSAFLIKSIADETMLHIHRKFYISFLIFYVLDRVPVFYVWFSPAVLSVLWPDVLWSDWMTRGFRGFAAVEGRGQSHYLAIRRVKWIVQNTLCQSVSLRLILLDDNLL